MYGGFGLGLCGLTLTETGALGCSTCSPTAKVPTTMNQLQLQICPDKVNERESERKKKDEIKKRKRKRKPMGNAAHSNRVGSDTFMFILISM